MRLQDAYEPGVEDWAFHAALPFAANASLAASALAASALAPADAQAAVFAAAGAVLALLVVGTHNAWDAVTYLVFVWGRGAGSPEAAEEA
jgi:hypothetical protein